jgi:iron complex outermembrane receptor protein
VFDDTVSNFADARLLRFSNTSLATLTGFEIASEVDLNSSLTPFASMHYVEGQDHGLGAALPAISPLESSLGLRLHDEEKGKTWGVEILARIVAKQNRPGSIGIGMSPVVATVIEEATPGFTVFNLRSYYNYTDNVHFVGGIENLFNRSYQEHLDLRLFGPNSFTGSPSRVLSPGITPYLGVDWTF